jgi:hypothetical protein
LWFYVDAREVLLVPLPSLRGLRAQTDTGEVCILDTHGFENRLFGFRASFLLLAPAVGHGTLTLQFDRRHLSFPTQWCMSPSV